MLLKTSTAALFGSMLLAGAGCGAGSGSQSEPSSVAESPVGSDTYRLQAVHRPHSASPHGLTPAEKAQARSVIARDSSLRPLIREAGGYSLGAIGKSMRKAATSLVRSRPFSSIIRSAGRSRCQPTVTESTGHSSRSDRSSWRFEASARWMSMSGSRGRACSRSTLGTDTSTLRQASVSQACRPPVEEKPGSGRGVKAGGRVPFSLSREWGSAI